MFGLFYLFMELIFLFIGVLEQMFGYVMVYFLIYFIGIFFVEVFVGLNIFINIQGCFGIVMLLIVIGVLFNILFDFLFIFVFDWGVKGVVFVIIILQVCSVGWVLFFLIFWCVFLWFEFCYMRLDWKVVGVILVLGVLLFIMVSIESLVGFVLNGLLKIFGDIYVSVLIIMQSVMFFVSVFFVGFVLGFVFIVSYNYGYGN